MVISQGTANIYIPSMGPLWTYGLGIAHLAVQRSYEILDISVIFRMVRQISPQILI